MSRERRGRFLGIPYDWTRPSRGSMLRDVWNPDDPRVFPPRTFGWGYGLNVAALLGRAGRRRDRD